MGFDPFSIFRKIWPLTFSSLVKKVVSDVPFAFAAMMSSVGYSTETFSEVFKTRKNQNGTP